MSKAVEPKPVGYQAALPGLPGPPPLAQHHRVLGVQHELEWGIAVVGLRPTIKDVNTDTNYAHILVQATTLFYEEGVELLTLNVGNMVVLQPSHQSQVRNETIESTYSIGPDAPAILVFKIEPLVAQLGISLMMTVPTDAFINLEVKTLDLMPLDRDPSTIDFQGLLWPPE